MFRIFRVILFFMAFWSSAVYATIAEPLGLEIGKANIEDVKVRYKIIRKGGIGDQYGYFYKIDPTTLADKYITEATINCQNDDIVKQVMLSITDKSKFELMFELLSEKYEMEINDSLFLEDKAVKFNAKNCVIFATKTGSMMYITYIDKDLYEKQTKDITKTQDNNALKAAL